MTIIYIQSKQNLLETISSLQKKQGHFLTLLYFYMENNELSHSISNFIIESNTRVNKFIFLLVNIKYPLNKDILEMFNVSFVPHGILLRDGYILQKFYGSDLIHFLRNLDGCTSTIYSDLYIDNKSIKIKKQKNKTLQRNNQTFNNDTLYDGKYYSDTDTLMNELDEKLERLVNNVPVMIFIKGTPDEPKCRYSRDLIELLRKNHIRFGFFNVLRNPFFKEELKRFVDWPTFPLVYLNGEFQGGLDIIIEKLDEDPMYFQKKNMT